MADMGTPQDNARMATGREIDRIPWVGVLSTDDRAWVVPRLRVRECTAGEFVLRAGDLPTHWYGVVEGMLVAQELGRA